MADAGAAVQKAIFARLSAALPIPVYDAVPATAGDRYVTIGHDTSDDFSTKDIAGQDISAEVHVIDSTHRGRLQVREVQEQIYAALDDQDLAVDAGEVFGVSSVEWQSSTVFLEDDGLTMHGISIFRIITTG